MIIDRARLQNLVIYILWFLKPNYFIIIVNFYLSMFGVKLHLFISHFLFCICKNVFIKSLIDFYEQVKEI